MRVSSNDCIGCMRNRCCCCDYFYVSTRKSIVDALQCTNKTLEFLYRNAFMRYVQTWGSWMKIRTVNIWITSSIVNIVLAICEKIASVVDISCRRSNSEQGGGLNETKRTVNLWKEIWDIRELQGTWRRKDKFLPPARNSTTRIDFLFLRPFRPLLATPHSLKL